MQLSDYYFCGQIFPVKNILFILGGQQRIFLCVCCIFIVEHSSGLACV